MQNLCTIMQFLGIHIPVAFPLWLSICLLAFTLLPNCLIASPVASSYIHRRIDRRPRPTIGKLKYNDVQQQLQQKQKQQENLEAERAMNSTLSKLNGAEGGQTERFVLLVCKTKCSKERAEIASWIREFNALQQQKQLQKQPMPTNQSAIADQQEPGIGFHFHLYRRPFPLADIERTINRRWNSATIGSGTGSQQASAILFYVTLGRAFPMEEPLGRKEDFLQWLDRYENPKILFLEDAEETNAWLNSQCHTHLVEDGQMLALRRLEQELVFLVVHDPELCAESQLKNMARFFSNRDNVIFLELHRPLSDDVDFHLHWRLPKLTSACQMVVLLQGDDYLEFANGISGTELQKIDSNLTFARKGTGIPTTSRVSNCSTTATKAILLGMHKILAPLTAIELEYWQQERHLKAIEHNRQYITVGTIGGVAVIALAMSIFWGLNGNDFVPKQ